MWKVLGLKVVWISEVVIVVVGYLKSGQIKLGCVGSVKCIEFGRFSIKKRVKF